MRLIFLLLSLSYLSLSATDYSKSYSVVIKESTYQKEAWKKVVSALVKKRSAKVITYKENVEESLPDLRKQFPKYVCFVNEPQDCGYQWTVRTHRMMRQLDSDIYTDAIFSTITGYVPEDALRIAKATLPKTATTALISAGVGPDRYKEAYFISTGKMGEHGHKKADGTKTIQQAGHADMTQTFINYFEKLDPDIVLSSAHASQETLEMPFSRGNIVCKNGKLFGYIAAERMIKTDGQRKKTKVKGTYIPIKNPVKPRVYFAVGNCLIGDIHKRDCMALAWMGHGKANQMIAYTATTWYGLAGWGTLKSWEQSGGHAPLNECFYFGGQNLMARLNELSPALASHSFDSSQKLSQHLLVNAMKRLKAPLTKDCLGMLWDRDIVAYYGDPANEVTLDKKHTFKARYTTSLKETTKGQWTLNIHAHEDYKTPKTDDAPMAVYFPKRLKNIKLLKGKEFKPVISDNFIMLLKAGPWKAGVDYQVTFSAEDI